MGKDRKGACSGAGVASTVYYLKCQEVMEVLMQKENVSCADSSTMRVEETKSRVTR